MLRLLEAFKLYLNLPNCVYFLGVDRETLEESIRLQYKDVKLNQVSYLDKIVQLPFDIPPIPVECMEDFVAPLLGQDLKQCKELLVEGLGKNPRQVKRFINTLTLCHALAKNLLRGYDPRLLSLILLIRSKSPSLYAALRSEPDILGRLTREPASDKLEEHKALHKKYLSDNEALARLLQKSQIPEELPREYVFLTRAARIEGESQSDLSERQEASKRSSTIWGYGSAQGVANQQGPKRHTSQLAECRPAWCQTRRGQTARRRPWCGSTRYGPARCR